MPSIDDLLVLCRRTLDGYDRAVARLDDHTINVAPPLPGANTAAQLVTHALGAGWWWFAHIVCGRPVTRDRDAEFEAVASRQQILDRLSRFRRDLDGLRDEMVAATELAHEPATQVPLDGEWTVGTALLHAYEELVQHLGHLEITTDLILTPSEI